MTAATHDTRHTTSIDTGKHRSNSLGSRKSLDRKCGAVASSGGVEIDESI